MKPTKRIIQVGNLHDDVSYFGSNPQYGRIYSADGIAPTINTCQGGGREPKIIVPTKYEDICDNSVPRTLKKRQVDAAV